MAKRISDLSAATSTDATDSDLLPIVDAEAGETKKITRANLLNDAVATASIQDDAVTTAKIADASITNAKLSTTAGELGGAWQSWTPTWTNLTIGNATVNGKYIQIGKTVHFSLMVTLGSTSSVGTNIYFTLPVEAASNVSASTPIATARYVSGGVSTYGVAEWETSTTSQLVAYTANTTYVAAGTISAAVPFTWTTGSVITLTGTYEAA